MKVATESVIQSIYKPVIAQVEGNVELSGNVSLSGFKHSSNLVLAAAMLSTSDITLHNVPKIADTEYLSNAATQFGFEPHIEGTSMKLVYESVPKYRDMVLPNADLHSSSYLIAKISLLGGGLIAGFGGCKIGDRFPYGAKWAANHFGVNVDKTIDGGIRVSNGNIIHSPIIDLRGADPAMHSLAQKTSILLASIYGGRIIGVKRYQEINDLLSIIMEARIAEVVVSDEDGSISFYPSESKPAEFQISPDPLEYITILAALASSNGKISFNNLPDANGIMDEIKAMKYLGVEIIGKKARASKDVEPIGTMEIASPPAYSDALPVIGSAAATIPGANLIITDAIWPNRKGYAVGLSQAGCNITVGKSITIQGKKAVNQAIMKPDNLRDAAGALVAALGFNSKTTIYGLENLNRGYDGLISKLVNIGARVWIKE